MQQKKKNLLLSLWVSLLLTFMVVGTAAAKSVYITTHHSASFMAYNLNAGIGDLTYQGTYSLQYANTPADVAVHNPSGTLFISEESYDIEVVDNNLNSVGRVNVGRQFAGLAVDDENDILYGMVRGGNQLYAWNFTAPATLTLISGFPITLSGLASQSGMGIVLDYRSDPKILWVADGYNRKIRAYDTTTWAEVDSIDTPSGHNAVGLSMDVKNRIIYYGSWRYGAWGPGSGTPYCYSINLDASPRTVVMNYVGAQVADIDVDEDTGLVYLTYVGGARVYNPSPWTQVDQETIQNSMAGICVAGVSYMPDLAIEKVDDVEDGDCRVAGEIITYTINYENTGATALTNVTIEDLLPTEADEVPGHTGSYNILTHTISWDIGDLAVGEVGSVSFDAQVNVTATPGSQIINSATIDSEETNPTTVQEYTDICTTPIQQCDVNNDGAVDILDIRQIGSYRGSTDPLDLPIYDIDNDGMVTVNDARACVLDCDNARCAIGAP